MAQVYFHCANERGVLVEECGADVDDLTEARELAAGIVETLIAAPTLEDWRGWVMHVRDDLGDELIAMPFSSLLGRLN
jgi:hypothetical protein